MEYNPGHVAALLEDLKEQHYLRVFTTAEGEIIGFIGFFVVPFTFNPNYIQAQEIFFFVHPAHRGEIGHDLLTQAELDLKDIADIMVCGDMMSSKDMTEYYEEHGFRLTERSYTKVL
jgi:predicted N-acetyltransferase YhbS